MKNKAVTSTLMILGIILTISEGRWFPWSNFGGLALMAIVAMIHREAEVKNDNREKHKA